jgi:SprT-like family
MRTSTRFGGAGFRWAKLAKNVGPGLMNGKDLRKLFQEFNTKYFQGRLPAYSIRVRRSMTSWGETGRCLKRSRIIEIQAGQSDEDAANTLLHEMAHAKTGAAHGMMWKKEMIRLREAGAPLRHHDSKITIDDWDGTRVSRTHFRAVAQDQLIDSPDWTLSQAVKWFIRNEGGGSTIAGFLKRYPWVRAEFSRLKRARAEEERRIAELRAILRKTQAGATKT